MSTLEYNNPVADKDPGLIHRDNEPTLENKSEPLPPYQPAPQQWHQPLLPPQQQAPPQYYPTPAGPPVQQQQTTNNVVVVQQPAYSTYAPDRPSDYLGLSLFACLCCCWPIAIVALVHSCQVNDRYNAGDYAGAIDSSQKARYWSKVAIIVGIVLTVVWVGLSVVSFGIRLAGATAAESY